MLPRDSSSPPRPAPTDGQRAELGSGSGVGPVETRFFTFAEDGEAFVLESGETLAPVTLAYEVYGELNRARDNAVLLFHALTGSQHAAGYNPRAPGLETLWTPECHHGWWDDFIGPGRALDTDRLCVLCVNYLGGCYGSTGPLSLSAATREPYGASFPRVSFADTVNAQLRLLDHLGIKRLRAAVGASTGGMACLILATRWPQRVALVVPMATGLATTALQRAQNFEQINAIENDPAFAGGAYEPGRGPRRGMALARMIAHKTFVSLEAMEGRFSHEIQDPTTAPSWYRLSHPLESYMVHQGEKFASRFDANSYLRILDAWQRFDLLQASGAAGLGELFGRCRSQRYLLFSIDSDECYPPAQQEEMARVLRQAGVPTLRLTVHSEKGHDSFLLEPELYAANLDHALGGRLAIR